MLTDGTQCLCRIWGHSHLLAQRRLPRARKRNPVVVEHPMRWVPADVRSNGNGLVTQEVDVFRQSPIDKVCSTQRGCSEEHEFHVQASQRLEHMRQEVIATDLLLGNPEVGDPAAEFGGGQHALIP